MAVNVGRVGMNGNWRIYIEVPGEFSVSITVDDAHDLADALDNILMRRWAEQEDAYGRLQDE